MSELITHVRDPKSGRIIEERHYSKIVVLGPQGEPQEVYERPPRSGIYYNLVNSTFTLDEKRSAEGLKRQADAKKAAEMTVEQRYNLELEAARRFLDEHEEKEAKQAAAAKRIQGGK